MRLVDAYRAHLNEKQKETVQWPAEHYTFFFHQNPHLLDGTMIEQFSMDNAIQLRIEVSSEWEKCGVGRLMLDFFSVVMTLLFPDRTYRSAR